MHNADTLISMVLNEGRKVRLRRVAAVSDGSLKPIPAFGRKIRRFGSKAPLIDKGGELSVVDKYGSSKKRRPNQRLQRGDYLGIFGPEPKSQKRQDRHQALMHLFHHMHQYALDNPDGITQSEYQEMAGHADRLLRAEAKSTHKAARRMARKSGMFAGSAKYKDRMSTPTSKVPKYIGTNMRPIANPSLEVDDFNDPAIQKADEIGKDNPSYDAKKVQNKLRTWTHDGVEHNFTGALPTSRGEGMASALHIITLDGEIDPRINQDNFEKLPDQEKTTHFNMQKSMYKLGQAHGSLPIKHDHKKTLEIARAVR